jgi:hypothetical protein
MMKLLTTLALLLGGFSFAQVPIDIAVGNRWSIDGGSGLYVGARATIALGREIWGQGAFLLPETGISPETLQPYVRAQLILDGEYATIAGDCRVTQAQQYCALELRFGY